MEEILDSLITSSFQSNKPNQPEAFVIGEKDNNKKHVRHEVDKETALDHLWRRSSNAPAALQGDLHRHTDCDTADGGLQGGRGKCNGQQNNTCSDNKTKANASDSAAHSSRGTCKPLYPQHDANEAEQMLNLLSEVGLRAHNLFGADDGGKPKLPRKQNSDAASREDLENCPEVAIANVVTEMLRSVISSGAVKEPMSRLVKFYEIWMSKNANGLDEADATRHRKQLDAFKAMIGVCDKNSASKSLESMEGLHHVLQELNSLGKVPDEVVNQALFDYSGLTDELGDENQPDWEQSNAEAERQMKKMMETVFENVKASQESRESGAADSLEEGVETSYTEFVDMLKGFDIDLSRIDFSECNESKENKQQR